MLVEESPPSSSHASSSLDAQTPVWRWSTVSNAEPSVDANTRLRAARFRTKVASFERAIEPQDRVV